MEIANKNSKEIQSEIFAEIRKGTSVEALKAELKKKGHHPEGYYFTNEEQHIKMLAEPKAPAGHLTSGQIVWGIVIVLILIIRIARCSSRM